MSKFEHLRQDFCALTCVCDGLGWIVAGWRCVCDVMLVSDGAVGRVRLESGYGGHGFFCDGLVEGGYVAVPSCGVLMVVGFLIVPLLLLFVPEVMGPLFPLVV